MKVKLLPTLATDTTITTYFTRPIQAGTNAEITILVPHKKFIIMRYLLLFALCLISCQVYCQTSTIARFWEKAITKKIDIPSELHSDSCYYSNTLLKVEFDKGSKITSFCFSDNAEEWLSKGLNKIRNSIDFSVLERYADSIQIGKRIVIVPVVISNASINCRSRTNNFWFNSRYYSFNGKLLEGSCLFVQPVEIFLYPPNH